MKKFDRAEKNVDELVPYAKNSRTHSSEQIDQIVNSIKEFGFTNPVIIDEDNTIIAGHGRVLAAEILKMIRIPCVQVKGWSEAQKKAYIIADNKIALNAGWDSSILALEFSALKDMDFDLSLTGFSEDEIYNLFPEEEKEGLTDEDAVPEIPEEPISRLGDIWLLGEHRVMCGDSTDAGSVALLMGGGKADQLVTDPPYNVSYEGKTKDALTIKNDEMSDLSFRAFLGSAFSAAFENMKAGATFYIWHADSEGYNFRGAVFDCGEEVRQCLIWKKQTMVMGRQDYHWKHEPCLYGWKKGAAHLWSSDRKQTTILEFDRPSRNDIHPTMKPVNLIEYQIKNNTKGSDIILDLFLGSGSTLIAAEKTGRKCYGMELDPKYVDVIIKRWQDFTGKCAKLEKTGQEFSEVGNGERSAIPQK